MVVQDVVLHGSLPLLLPAGATGGPPPPVWRPTQTNRQGEAARSVRTSSREEDSRSTDEEGRLLTKRCIGWHRANTWEHQ